ncbi:MULTISPECIES: helix-turn-helix domain-containing protein [Streptomyces]|uniref:HTH cro/C1-type domain-containing protein n=1 Tax=Streptomyces mordarskii TaxID=1226758 RepID=A0ABN1DWU1_9ACTN
MTSTGTTVRIIECTYTDELHRHYDGQTEAQDAYIELDLREGTLLASYNAEIGNAIPFTVHHGFERRYGIPTLTGDAADRAMEEIRPLAERILADWEEHWDGNNMVARLGEDAQAAEEEIEEKLGDFDESDMVTEWDIDGATNGCEVDVYGITADTTDERLDEIEATIIKDLVDVSASDVVVCHGLDTYLRDVRDELAEEDPLNPAELRAAREYLGLTGDHLAKLLGVNPRTLRSWEQGRDSIPGRIRPEIAELKAAADKAVAEMVESCQGEEEPVLITYRDDEEYQAANRGGRWTASWHRRICARAAEQTRARIDYAETDED